MEAAAAPQTTGTVTFLFTDIEGSSRLWENHGDAMAAALARHDSLLRATFQDRGGHIFKTIGDAFCVVFPAAPPALYSAVAVQRLLVGQDWGALGQLKVRMGLHTGVAENRDNDYFGPVLNRVSRLLTAAHGGQVLLTLATEELVRDQLPPGVSLRDLGERRLRDLNRPERIFQVAAPDLPSDFPALRSLELFPNNLPVQLTSFIGREKEMAEVRRLLGTTHILTLTGAGGTGKTRLSLQVAADLLDQFPDGVWLTELATLETPDLVAPAAAAALGVPEEPGRPMLVTLTNFLRAKKLLLIIDNCEHLVSTCAQLAGNLLRAAPGLQILATSREPLAITGERTWPVPSLAIPDSWREDAARPGAAERISQYEAVRLFADRAAAVRPAFRVTDANASSVAQICSRLDGIPLAIELAAARIRVLSVDQIASRLDDQFRLLTGGSRTALPRQQTLRALIDWSFSLLTEPERVLVRRLAVFAGGRTLQAVEAVCADELLDELEIVDLLTSLVDKSLVSVERSPGRETRYIILESVWEYSREKLAAAGETDSIRARHLQFFHAFAAEAAPHLLGPGQVQWGERIHAEFYNFRNAINASLEIDGLAPLGLSLCISLARYWESRSLIVEARDFCSRLLAHPANAAPTAQRAAGLALAGRLAWIIDDLTPGAAFTTEALAIWRTLGDEHGIAAAALDLAFYRFDFRQTGDARALVAEAEAIAQRLADKRLLALVRRAQGMDAGIQRRFPEALALHEASLALYRELGDSWHCGIGTWAVGINATILGDFQKARDSFTECLNSAWQLRNRWALAYPLEAFAALAVAQGQFERAARLLGAAEALRAEYGITMETSDHPTLRELIAGAAAEFARPEISAARKEGRALTAQAAVDFALASG